MKKELERLLREQRDDASQRPLHEKGVRYEDEQPFPESLELADFQKLLDQKASLPAAQEKDPGRER